MKKIFKILIIIILISSCSKKINTIVIDRYEDGSRKIVLKIINKGKKNAVVLNKTVYDNKGHPQHIQNKNRSGQLNGIQLDSIYYPPEKEFIQIRTIYQNDSKVIESSKLGNMKYKKSHKYSFAKLWEGVHLELENIEFKGKEYQRVIFKTSYRNGKKHGVQTKFSSCQRYARCNDNYYKEIFWINDQIISDPNAFNNKFNNIIN